MSINSFHLSGRATKDPIIKEGKSHLILGLAVNRYDRNAENKETTDFFNVWVYGKQAQVVQDFVRKGDRVFVQGTVGTFKKQGAEFAETVLRADTVEFATIATETSRAAAHPDAAPEPKPAPRRAPKDDAHEEMVDEDGNFRW